MSGPHNKHYRCTYPKSGTWAKGRATFDGECVSKHDEATIRFQVAGRLFGPTQLQP